MGSASAAAESDALALALSSGACEDGICETWIDTASAATSSLETCSAALSGNEGSLQECLDVTGELEVELDTLITENDGLSGELDLLGAELDACTSGGPADLGGPVLDSMLVSSSAPLPWTLPSEPVSFSVDDANLFDSAFGNPGCCSTYDVLITCAD